ncbi:MAG: RnfABCDGE type electron transport complex subunit D [Clostridia bacterium]|nr:RnfABCDGE type electron transport complex subunit D [Clostridia bacterium]
MDKFFVSVSPHITAKHTTKSIMLEVCIALIPAVIAAIFFFGFYSIFIIAISIASTVFGEYIFNVIRKKEHTIKDCSAVVTGLLLGLNLPVTVPFYVPIVGGLFAILVVKMLFGGIGRNFANPAITGRIFLVLAWAGVMTKFVPPIDWTKGFDEGFKFFSCILNGGGSEIEAVTSATPLGIIKGALSSNVNGLLSGENISLLDMFLGRTGGTIGETSALALLIGGLYLGIRKIIDWKIPVVYVATVALFALIFGGVEYILPSILGGGLLLGAIFMATDYATNPNTPIGTIIFAFGCGFITVSIRFFGGYPEGVSFAILLMNVVTPLIDKYIKPPAFGFVKPVKVKKSKEGNL